MVVVWKLQVPQKQASDATVTDKLSKLSVKDSQNEHDGVGESGDHPPSKKTKSNSRSRRRRKGRRNDPSVAVNEGATCEFVRGGGGKVHGSSAPRRDWFSVDAANKHSSFDSDSAFSQDNKDRREGTDRRKAAPPVTVEGSSESGKSAGAATNRGKELKNSAKVNDSSQSVQASKSLASKELSGERRQVATYKSNVSASGAEVNKFSKVQSTQLESG